MGRRWSSTTIGLYGQDTWRASDRLTLNLGLRWEPFLGQALRDETVTVFNPDNFAQNVRSTVFRNAPAGFLYPGDADFPVGSTGLHKQWLNFSPRVGVAWDPNGDGRLAVRSSYSLTYDFPAGQYHMRNAAQPPFGNRTQVNDPPGGFDDPYGHLPGGDPHPAIPGPETIFPPFGSLSPMDPNLNSPRVQSWNVTVERQLGTGWAAAVSYLGNYTDRVWNILALNPGTFLGTGRCTIAGPNGTSRTFGRCGTRASLNFRRLLYQQNPDEAQLIGALDQHTDIGATSYRGLKLSLRRRSATGVGFNANYTWSRCFGDDARGATMPQANSGYTNPADPDHDDGYCAQHRPHLASLSVVARTPDFGDGVLGVLAANWRASGILSARSGSALNVTAGRDRALNGLSNQRPNQVSDDIYGEKTLTSYLNRDAFAQPELGGVWRFRP